MILSRQDPNENKNNTVEKDTDFTKRKQRKIQMMCINGFTQDFPLNHAGNTTIIGAVVKRGV